MPSDRQIHNSLFSQCQKFVASFKHHLGNKGYIFNTLALKANSGYDYIQDNCFIEQQLGEKKFMFKMSMDGGGSKCDLMKQMKPGNDLQIT